MRFGATSRFASVSRSTYGSARAATSCGSCSGARHRTVLRPALARRPPSRRGRPRTARIPNRATYFPTRPRCRRSSNCSTRRGARAPSPRSGRSARRRAGTRRARPPSEPVTSRRHVHGRVEPLVELVHRACGPPGRRTAARRGRGVTRRKTTKAAITACAPKPRSTRPSPRRSHGEVVRRPSSMTPVTTRRRRPRIQHRRRRIPVPPQRSEPRGDEEDADRDRLRQVDLRPVGPVRGTTLVTRPVAMPHRMHAMPGGARRRPEEEPHQHRHGHHRARRGRRCPIITVKRSLVPVDVEEAESDRDDPAEQRHHAADLDQRPVGRLRPEVHVHVAARARTPPWL